MQKWKELQLDFRKYVGKVQRQMIYKSESKNTGIKKKDVLGELKVILQEGEYSISQGDLDTAEKKYIEAVRLDSKNIEAYFGLGSVYYSQGQVDEAIETFKFILQIDDGDVKTLVKLAEIEEKKNNIEGAVEYYDRALLLEDSNPARFAKVADLLYALNKCDGSIEAISQAVELEPQNPKYLDKMVEISVSCGNREMAETAWGRLRMVNQTTKSLSL